MANNRMFLVHRSTGYGVFLGKHMGYGWYGVPGDVRDRIVDLFQKIEDEFQNEGQDDFLLAMEHSDNPRTLDGEFWDYTELGDSAQNIGGCMKPTVTIIIPVGPGHETLAEHAVASVIEACDNPGPFGDVRIRMVDDMEGKLGRSKARNIGAKEATADWLFFLDADDLLLDQAFTNVEPYLGHDAVWGLIVELRPNDVMVARTQALELDSYNGGLKGYINYEPFLTCQMGHFVKREVFEPFDEEMDVGEDVKYYLNMWKNHDCVKIRRPFFINRRGRHSQGPRSATGRQWNLVTSELMREAREQAKSQPETAA